MRVTGGGREVGAGRHIEVGYGAGQKGEAEAEGDEEGTGTPREKRGCAASRGEEEHREGSLRTG